jgi:hypothetical protein
VAHRAGLLIGNALLCIRSLLGSILGWNMGYSGWRCLWFFSVPPRKCPDGTSHHDHFLPYHFQFIHKSSTIRRYIVWIQREPQKSHRRNNTAAASERYAMKMHVATGLIAWALSGYLQYCKRVESNTYTMLYKASTDRCTACICVCMNVWTVF